MKIENQWFRRLRAVSPKLQPSESHPVDDGLVRKVTNEIVTILTPERRPAWQNLVGPPYLGPIGSPFSGGGPPPPPPDR